MKNIKPTYKLNYIQKVIHSTNISDLQMICHFVENEHDLYDKKEFGIASRLLEKRAKELKKAD